MSSSPNPVLLPFPHADDLEEYQAIRDDGMAGVQSSLHLALPAPQPQAGHPAGVVHHRLLFRQLHRVGLCHATADQNNVGRRLVLSHVLSCQVYYRLV